MREPTLKGQRLVALFLLGCLMLNYPIMSLFAGPALYSGIPGIYLYLFAAWGVIIVAMALIAESKDQ